MNIFTENIAHTLLGEIALELINSDSRLDISSLGLHQRESNIYLSATTKTQAKIVFTRLFIEEEHICSNCDTKQSLINKLISDIHRAHPILEAQAALAGEPKHYEQKPGASM
jgi:hypothetical protein